ncbi:putative Heterokaryon incompatibility protein-domain-containing protein [Seiridium cardinale]
MRLLNTETHKLGSLEGQEIPKYAMLSHTWGDGEISFQDLNEPQSSTWRQHKAYHKLEGSCRKAIKHGYDWIWIDTCCIDKSSSTELSEVCYVYMADLAPGAHRAARVPIGDVLACTSTARIMSWAAKRQTKKEEDNSYSLMGLFDVNMPLLYGEGSKASIRLQNEIVGKRKDQSILAWRAPDHVHSTSHPSLLEISPIARCPGFFQPLDGIGTSLNVSRHALGYPIPQISFVDENLNVDLLLCPVYLGKNMQIDNSTEVLAAILDATVGSDVLYRLVILISRNFGDSRRRNEKYRRFSQTLYCLSAGDPSWAVVINPGSTESISLDLERAKETPVTFVKMGPSPLDAGGVKYVMDWRNCTENSSYVIVFEGRLKEMYSRFMVVWSMRGTGDAYAASEAKYYCKIWSHWDIARQFPQKDQPSNSKIDQTHLDLVISHDDIYNKTYDSQLVKVVTSLVIGGIFPMRSRCPLE